MSQKIYQQFKAILFDLDGTLIDSAPDIATATNRLLEENHLEPLSLTEIRSMIGNGIVKLFERAFAARGVSFAQEDFQMIVHRGREIYNEHLTEKTTLLAGAKELIDKARQEGCKIAVVTNKPERPSRIILEYFDFNTDKIDVVLGGDSCSTRKPDPEMITVALEKLNVTKDQAVLIGDSPADYGAAKAAGIPCILVEGGYTNVPISELDADKHVGSLMDLV